MSFYYFERNCIRYKTIYTTKKGEHFYMICHKLWTHCLKGSALDLFSLWPTRIISFLKASLQLITVGMMFLKIQPFQHLHIHHEIVMIVSILQLLRSYCFICRATNWMLEVFGGEIPIILQHLFVKSHLRNNGLWFHLFKVCNSRMCMIQAPCVFSLALILCLTFLAGATKRFFLLCLTFKVPHKHE